MKKWNKLVTLGCSLSPKGYWPRSVAEYIGVSDSNWTHFGFGGSGNQLLLHLWNDYFLKNDLSDTLVIWEITGLNRHSGVYKLSKQRQMDLEPADKWDGENPGYWMQYKSFFDDKTKFGLFGRFGKFEDLHQNDVDAQLVYADLVTTLSTIPCDVLIFRGWSGAVFEPKWQKSIPIFEKYGKTVISEPYVDWVTQRNLPMWSDGVHPEHDSSVEYFNHVIKSYLDKM